MKIIGYGICGAGESTRYMRETLEEFKRLCDEVIILCCNAGQAEIDLIKEFDFEYRLDRREWGKFQWKIKQDFLERDIKLIANEGDMLVCLDMDEVLDSKLTKEWIRSAPLDAYHVFVVDLWNDREHYKPESCFWNVRLWRWNGLTKFKQKPVHCGLAPEWAYHYHRHAPFILKHYGLMDPEDRQRKVKRYERYDPKAEYLDKKFYKMLDESTAKPFNEELIHDTIEKEVNTYQQTKPRQMPKDQKKPERFAWVQNPHGIVIDIPEKHVKETLARKGFTFIGWADEAQEEIDRLFDDEETIEGAEETDEVLLDPSDGSYQRSTRSIEQDFKALNQADDEALGLVDPIITEADDLPVSAEFDEDDAEPFEQDIRVENPEEKVETTAKKATSKKKKPLTKKKK